MTTPDPADRAEQIEQRYVGEYDDAADLVEGLDPDADEQSTEQVKAVAPDTATEREVDEMADGT